MITEENLIGISRKERNERHSFINRAPSVAQEIKEWTIEMSSSERVNDLKMNEVDSPL